MCTISANVRLLVLNGAKLHQMVPIGYHLTIKPVVMVLFVQMWAILRKCAPFLQMCTIL